jgi:hypothetical protein
MSRGRYKTESHIRLDLTYLCGFIRIIYEIIPVFLSEDIPYYACSEAYR